MYCQVFGEFFDNEIKLENNTLLILYVKLFDYLINGKIFLKNYLPKKFTALMRFCN